MEIKSLLMGIAFSVGLFAVKSGVGLSYFLSRNSGRRETGRSRIMPWAVFGLAYALVFVASVLVLESVDLTQHLGAFQAWIRSGMTLHLLMAGLLTLWGLRLLRDGGKTDRPSHGWIPLVVPCPVCATVILLSLGFLRIAFPESLRLTAFLLWLSFLGVSSASVAATKAGTAAAGDASPESLLGGAMLLISAYFLLSVTVMPNIADLEKIYRISGYSPVSESIDIRRAAIFATALTFAFLSGFGLTRRRMRRIA